MRGKGGMGTWEFTQASGKDFFHGMAVQHFGLKDFQLGVDFASPVICWGMLTKQLLPRVEDDLPKK